MPAYNYIILHTVWFPRSCVCWWVLITTSRNQSHIIYTGNLQRMPFLIKIVIVTTNFLVCRSNATRVQFLSNCFQQVCLSGIRLSSAGKECRARGPKRRNSHWMLIILKSCPRVFTPCTRPYFSLLIYRLGARLAYCSMHTYESTYPGTVLAGLISASPLWNLSRRRTTVRVWNCAWVLQLLRYWGR